MLHNLVPQISRLPILQAPPLPTPPSPTTTTATTTTTTTSIYAVKNCRDLFEFRQFVHRHPHPQPQPSFYRIPTTAEYTPMAPVALHNIDIDIVNLHSFQGGYPKRDSVRIYRSNNESYCTYVGTSNVRAPCPNWILPSVIILLIVAVICIIRIFMSTRRARHSARFPPSPFEVDPNRASAEAQLPDEDNHERVLYEIIDVPKSSVKHLTENDVCPICIEPLKSPKALARGPCEHIFHKTCIVSWVNKQNGKTCPTCRMLFETVVVRDPARNAPNSRHYELDELFELQLRGTTDSPV